MAARAKVVASSFSCGHSEASPPDSKLRGIFTFINRVDRNPIGLWEGGVTMSRPLKGSSSSHWLTIASLLCLCAAALVPSAVANPGSTPSMSDANLTSLKPPRLQTSVQSGSLNLPFNPKSDGSKSSEGSEGGSKMAVDVGGGLFWGLPDAVVAVGTLFHYEIPADAFKGPVADYKVYASAVL